MRIKLLALTLLVATAGLVATTAAPAGAHCGFPHGGPAGRTVVLHAATGRGGFTPPGSEITVRANGDVTIDPRGNGGDPVHLTITHAQLHALLERARDAGLAHHTDYGDAQITDQATTVISVRDGRARQRVAVYALFFGGAGYGPSDLGLTRAQRVARGRLADFVDALDDPTSYARLVQHPHRRHGSTTTTTTTPASGTIAHPTGANDVVLHTETSDNYWGGTYPDAVTFTLYGDGRLVVGATDALTVYPLTEAQVQQVLHDAQHVGLLGGTDYGDPLVTDQGTTTVEVHAGGVDRTYDLYALELVEGDRGLPPAQREARRALRAFLHGMVPSVSTTVRA